MTKQEHDKLNEISAAKPWEVTKQLRDYLATITPSEGQNEPPTGNYTDSQRNASWLYMLMKANQLNDAGLEMRVVLKPSYQIPWTKDTFHDHVWIPIQKAKFRTDTMRALKKDQPGEIHALIEREFSEKHGTEYIPFPSSDEKALENLKGVKLGQTDLQSDYPEYQGKPTF